MLVWDGLDVLLVGKVEALAQKAIGPRTLVGMDVDCKATTIGMNATMDMGNVAMGCWGIVQTNDWEMVGWTFF